MPQLELDHLQIRLSVPARGALSSDAEEADVRGVEGRAIWGKFLKDYEPADW
mgnify:CR=1 FL=1